MEQILLSCLLSFATTALSNATSTCYFPDGVSSADYTPCGDDTSFRACCAPGDECLTNGLCKAVGMRSSTAFWRELCTDASWQSAACPKYCYNETTSTYCVKHEMRTTHRALLTSTIQVTRQVPRIALCLRARTLHTAALNRVWRCLQAITPTAAGTKMLYSRPHHLCICLARKTHCRSSLPSQPHPCPFQHPP